VVDLLNRELRAILAQEEVKERFAGFGGVAAASTPEGMRERVEREIARWNRVVESRKIERQ
jgi:tripartite-type tricarboxylate transporter receptor subunit TctC